MRPRINKEGCSPIFYHPLLNKKAIHLDESSTQARNEEI